MAASLAGRRWGPVVAGTIGGLPVVAGPVLLVIALDHGRAFGARAAVGTLLGLVALASFAVVYARVSLTRDWRVSLLCGWLAYLLVAAALRPLHPPVGAALAAAIAAILAAARLIPTDESSHRGDISSAERTKGRRVAAARPPAWDLPLRAASTVTMVLLLTGVAGLVGPAWSGLLTPFPVIGSILPAFAHAQQGGAAARATMRGIQLGLGGFVAFSLVVALTERDWGTGPAFAAASGAAVVVASAITAARAVPK